MSAPTTSVARPGRRGVRSGRLARFRADHQPGPWTREATGLTVVVALLVLAGLVMTFSASFVDGAQSGDPFASFRRQLVWVVLGVPVFWVTAGLDHRVWRRWSWPLLGVAVLGLLLVLTPVGLERYGAQSWLGFGPVSIQPSELAKLALLLWLADVLERKRPRDGSVQRTEHLLVPAVPALGVIGVLLMLQPDLGTSLVLGMVVAAVLFVEGLSGRLFVAMGVGAALLTGVLAATAAYRLARITGWLAPEEDPLGAGFQLTQSLAAMADGGLFGLGLGASRAKWNFLPNAENDFIFAIIGEELGFVGAVAIVALFVAILHLGLKVAYQAEDAFGRTVAACITAWTVAQAFFNIGTVTGLLPITGITLPLVSAGGSSLLVTLASLGILVAIARRPGAAADPAPPPRRRLEIAGGSS